MFTVSAGPPVKEGTGCWGQNESEGQHEQCDDESAGMIDGKTYLSRLYSWSVRGHTHTQSSRSQTPFGNTTQIIPHPKDIACMHTCDVNALSE